MRVRIRVRFRVRLTKTKTKTKTRIGANPRGGPTQQLGNDRIM